MNIRNREKCFVCFFINVFCFLAISRAHEKIYLLTVENLTNQVTGIDNAWYSNNIYSSCPRIKTLRKL